MATGDYELATPPAEARALELWLQHGAGFVLFEDARRYAIDRVAPGLGEDARAAAQKGIDDALYGLMMILDGTTGRLSNATARIELQVLARLLEQGPDGETLAASVDLARGDGMCMGFHGWRDGDFGDTPLTTPRPTQGLLRP